MSSTRYSQQPLHIYQDPASSFDRAPMPSEHTSNIKEQSPLRLIKNAASRRNIVFNPPQDGPSKQSPLKSAQQASSSPSRAPFSIKLNTISMPPPGRSSYNTDSMEKKQHSMSNYKPHKVLFSNFSTNASTDQENYPQPYPAPIAPSHDRLAASNFSLEGFYGQKPPKRLMDAAPIHESRPFKRTKLPVLDFQEEDNIEYVELPAPDSFPPLIDDGMKPSHSYAQLIGMSILRAPNRRLTLAQIYKWISDTYTFYSATDSGWQNSIRHNLSLNKAFIKQERPKDDPGKGNYWAIQPGMEHQFIKDKMTRKPPGPNETVSVLSTNLSPVNLPETAQFKPPPPPFIRVPDPPPPQSYPIPEPQLSTSQELSSDATIPGSDACNTEPEVEDEPEIPSSPLMHSSPPAAAMHSSPPVSRHTQKRHDTPPPVPRFPSSRNRSHKRKYASMDDSGYFSSLDSSALRPHRLLTSEADQPRMMRGRAEEEIARLRGSSYDSPTKARSLFAPPSSSPMRVSKIETSQMLPPLTPAVKLKPPVRLPPSVSPNTNLRLHRDRVREMVGSPLRGMTTLDENTPWSPAFHLDESSPCMFQDFDVDFDVFTDSTSGLLGASGTGSPQKKSAKRSRLDRSRSANILADTSGTNLNKSVSSIPLVIEFNPHLGSVFNSPLKGLGMCQSPSKVLGLDSQSKIPGLNYAASDSPRDDFVGSGFLSEDPDEGWDIMQGFQKIGSGPGNAPGQNTKRSPKASRLGLPRSFTSRF